jgi:hypothetical protein
MGYPFWKLAKKLLSKEKLIYSEMKEKLGNAKNEEILKKMIESK